MLFLGVEGAALHAGGSANPAPRAAGGNRAGDPQHRVRRPTAGAGRRFAGSGAGGHLLPRRRRRKSGSSAQRRRAGTGRSGPRAVPASSGETRREAPRRGPPPLRFRPRLRARWSTSTTASSATPSTTAPSATLRAGSRRGQGRLLDGLHEAGVGGCIKHFPGLGRGDRRYPPAWRPHQRDESRARTGSELPLLRFSRSPSSAMVGHAIYPAGENRSGQQA